MNDQKQYCLRIGLQNLIDMAARHVDWGHQWKETVVGVIVLDCCKHETLSFTDNIIKL